MIQKAIVYIWISVFVFFACQDQIIKNKNLPKVDLKNVKDVKATALVAIKNDDSHSVQISEENLNKAFVSLQDSGFHLNSNIRLDHRIFGYEKADTSSKKRFLLSVFTDEVEGNPYHCELGAYYDTWGMGDLSLKYIGQEVGFIKVLAIDKNKPSGILYFEKRWVEFK